MLIPFLAASAVGIALIKLGAMSVQISVLRLAIKAALAVIALLVAPGASLFGLLLWRDRFKASLSEQSHSDKGCNHSIGTDISSWPWKVQD